jgi:hypothetical protein
VTVQITHWIHRGLTSQQGQHGSKFFREEQIRLKPKRAAYGDGFEQFLKIRHPPHRGRTCRTRRSAWESCLLRLRLRLRVDQLLELRGSLQIDTLTFISAGQVLSVR